MATYVDALIQYPTSRIKVRARKFGNAWCHLTSDTLAELHEMAQRIGLPRSAYQHHVRPALQHYDVTPSKRALAVRFGAIEVDSREHLLRRMGKEQDLGDVERDV